MIEEVVIDKVGSYNGPTQLLHGLSKFNYLYGANGAGKTTISKIINDPEQYPTCPIKWKNNISLISYVYNKDFVERNFTTLSGGEQQRVILARALTQETECLVLDEPTNHLDIKYQLQIMDIVKSLNLTVIAAIHDLNIASMYCDRLIALKNGKIVGEGSPKKLLTENFIKDIYEVETKVEMLNNGSINIRYLPNHWQENLLMDYNKN